MAPYDFIQPPTPDVRPALIARDSASLSPARSQLATILHQIELLKREGEPIHAQLSRCDNAVQLHDHALRKRDELLADHEAAIAEAIAKGDPLPDPPAALDDAEIQLRQAAVAERGVAKLRGMLNTHLATIQERMGELLRESEELTSMIAVEVALDFARFRYASAFRSLNAISAVIDGIEQALLEQGRLRMQNGGDGTGPMRAVERLNQELRRLRTELGSDNSPNLGPGRRLLASLASDPTAELEGA